MITLTSILTTALAAANFVTAETTKQRSLLLIHATEASPPSLKSWLSRPDSEVILRKSITANLYNEQLADKLGDGNNYDNVIMLAGALPKQMSPEDLLEFVKRGGNLFWALPSDLLPSMS